MTAELGEMDMESGLSDGLWEGTDAANFTPSITGSRDNGIKGSEANMRTKNRSAVFCKVYPKLLNALSSSGCFCSCPCFFIFPFRFSIQQLKTDPSSI
jgi:hypothetical protein